MPVGYVAPGPVSMAGAFGGGHRGGYGGGGPDVVQLHDDRARLQNQLDLAGEQGNIESNQIAQRGQVQAALGRQAAELDVWQYQQRVTEQEAMQLRQDQNAIAAVDADPTLSPLEKMQAKTRIRSRIDWVSERQKRDMQQAQVEMYQAHASQYKMQADLDEQRIQNTAALMQNRTRTLTDPTKLSQIDAILRDRGIDPNSPQGVAERDRVAQEEGWAATYAVVNAKGDIGTKPIFGFGAEGGTHDAKKAETTQLRQDRAAGEDHKQWSDTLHRVQGRLDKINKDLRAEGKPELSGDVYEKTLAEEMARAGYAATWPGNQSAAHPAAPKPTDPQSLMGALAQRQDLSPAQQSEGARLIAQAKDIFDKYYASGEPVPKSIQRHYADLKKRYDQVTAATRSKFQ